MNNFNSISSLGHQKNDSERLKVQKAFLTYLAMFMSLGGLIWGSICLYYGLEFQSMIPLGYVVISVFNLTYFKVSKNFNVVRVIQVFISLALPFLFQWSLGGFYASGLIMLWALLSLIASLSFGNPKSSFIWLFLFIALTVISGIYDNYFILNYKPEILAAASINFTILNISVITTIVFSLVVYFVNNLNVTQLKLEEKQLEIQKSNTSLRKAQKIADQKNEELQIMKDDLIEITNKQTEINGKLIQGQVKNQ